MRFVKSRSRQRILRFRFAFVCMGRCLLIWPGISAVMICYVLGTASVLYGVIKLFGYFSEDLYQLAFSSIWQQEFLCWSLEFCFCSTRTMS